MKPVANFKRKTFKQFQISTIFKFQASAIFLKKKKVLINFKYHMKYVAIFKQKKCPSNFKVQQFFNPQVPAILKFQQFSKIGLNKFPKFRVLSIKNLKVFLYTSLKINSATKEDITTK